MAVPLLWNFSPATSWKNLSAWTTFSFSSWFFAHLASNRRCNIADKATEHGGHQRPFLLRQALCRIEEEVTPHRGQPPASRGAALALAAFAAVGAAVGYAVGGGAGAAWGVAAGLVLGAVPPAVRALGLR